MRVTASQNRRHRAAAVTSFTLAAPKDRDRDWQGGTHVGAV